MVDFEFAAEREDIERPDSLDAGVGPDPVLSQGGDETPAPGATALDGAGDETPLTIPDLPVADDAPTYAFDDSGVMPGAGFNYEFGLYA